jgi:indole-3-glycerol phosphate synthase
MHGREDVERAASAGADAVLIGTALSRAADPVVLLHELTSVPRRAR